MEVYKQWISQNSKYIVEDNYWMIEGTNHVNKLYYKCYELKVSNKFKYIHFKINISEVFHICEGFLNDRFSACSHTSHVCLEFHNLIKINEKLNIAVQIFFYFSTHFSFKHFAFAIAPLLL